MDKSVVIAFSILIVFSGLAVGVFLLDNPIENTKNLEISNKMQVWFLGLNEADQNTSSSKSLAVRYNEQGNEYYKNKQYDLAESFYKQAIDNNPILPNPYYNLGVVYYEQGQQTNFTGEEHIKARFYFEKALEFASDDRYKYYYMLANVYYVIAEKGESEFYMRSEQYLKKAIEVEDNVWSHRELVYVYGSTGRYAEAYDELAKAVSMGLYEGNRDIILGELDIMKDMNELKTKKLSGEKEVLDNQTDLFVADTLFFSSGDVVLFNWGVVPYGHKKYEVTILKVGSDAVNIGSWRRLREMNGAHPSRFISSFRVWGDRSDFPKMIVCPEDFCTPGEYILTVRWNTSDGNSESVSSRVFALK